MRRSVRQPVRVDLARQQYTSSTRKLFSAAAIFAAAQLVTTVTWASPELAAQYDGRSVAMAGTGSTFLHNGASVFYNPAGLDGIAQLAVTGVASPFLPKSTVPLESPNGSSSSTSQVVPLFLLGGAYRVMDRLVLGLAAYPSQGFGAKYAKVQAMGGQDLSLTTALIEVSPAASFRIADGLAVGASYRFTYASQQTEAAVAMPDPSTGAMTPMAVANDLTGTSFAGLGLGISYAPTSDLNLAATYRSQITADLSGTTTMAGQTFETKSTTSTPHRLQIEASHQFLNDQLLLAVSAKYLFYKGSNHQVDTVMQTPAGAQTNSVELNWQNVPGFAFGGEYLATETVPVRLGYSLAKSATPTENASPLAPGPGWTHAVHGGAGLKLESFDVDLGGEYLFARGHGEPTAGLPGAYDFDGLVLSLSGTYRR